MEPSDSVSICVLNGGAILQLRMPKQTDSRVGTDHAKRMGVQGGFDEAR